ncbi:hypothetical protein Q3G72_007236 [Acer saccharum]|nr:hypothetical protein Q3G72_007236 [Acer saccharum]
MGQSKVILQTHLLEGFRLSIQQKRVLEVFCPGIVSCADILALAARDAVEIGFGCSWNQPIASPTNYYINSSLDKDLEDNPAKTKEYVLSKSHDLPDQVKGIGQGGIAALEDVIFLARCIAEEALTGKASRETNKDSDDDDEDMEEYRGLK